VLTVTTMTHFLSQADKHLVLTALKFLRQVFSILFFAQPEQT
jgi:hypothetical protein